MVFIQRRLVSIVVLALGFVVATASAHQAKRPFTIVDEIGLTMFGTADGGPPELHFSPDGKYFAVWAERGRLDLNRPEDSLRFYRTQDVKAFLDHSEQSEPPSPIWVITRATYKQQRSIESWRWIANSSGVAFLERTSSGSQRLVLTEINKKEVKPLTSETDDIRAFNLRDRQHYLYMVVDMSEWENWRSETQKPAVIATGRPIDVLLFPDDPKVAGFFPPRSETWAVLDGKHFETKHIGVLSPDGHSLISTLPVTDVPKSWETLYPPQTYNQDRIEIHAGGSANQYVRIDLQTGTTQSLTNAPVSEAAGWFAGGDPSWSSDGQAILLPHSFVESKDNAPSRPCVAVVDLPSKTVTCVERFKSRLGNGMAEDGYHRIANAYFVGEDKNQVMVSFRNRDYSPGYSEYQRTSGSWHLVKHGTGDPETTGNGIEVRVKQGINDAPVLVASDKQISRVIWDPNPQLKNFELEDATVYTWRDDKEGKEWKGGLYKPVGYTPGKKYPLVIQTHGFPETEFRPSGIFTTAFAARELAAAGIMVLQIALGKTDIYQECPDGIGEAPCAASMAESAAAKLVSEGLVDPDNIGVIGFSRTCYQVMEMLTATSSIHLKAASITDGVMFDYLQYILGVDLAGDAFLKESDSAIGAPPFGEGLQQWLKRSPGFNLDKVKTPLLVVGEGRDSLFSMLQPYAGLRALHKPTELVMLNTDEHVLTNPAMRMASQGGSVDWFRFWLQGYEDSDPAKADQYKRWRELKKLQEENNQTRRSASN
jgi:dipeptidyl aminopeptidase/acylaminoacyl peptidase